jgi:hypothetical protein
MIKPFAFSACCLVWALQGSMAFAQGATNGCDTVQVQKVSDLDFGTVYFSRGQAGRVAVYPNDRIEALTAGVSLPLAPNHSPGKVVITGPANSLIYLSVSNPITRTIQVDEIKLVNPNRQLEAEKRGEFWVVQTKNFPSVDLNIAGTLNFSGLSQRQSFITTFTVTCELVQPD